MALTRVSGISSDVTISGVVTVTSVDATSVETNIVQIGSGTTIHTTGIDLGSGNIQSHNIHSSGIITATQFVGDGSLLTGIAGGAGGAGIDIKSNGSNVGFAGTVNFGPNLTVTPVSAGITTITTSISKSLAIAYAVAL